jgi:6-phosphogluconolactonase
VDKTLGKYITAIATLLAFGLCVGCGSSGGNHALYLISPSSNQVAAYSISGGSLNQLGNTASTGTTPMALAVPKSNKFLYTANYGSNDISMFTIQSDGSLSSSATTITTGLRPVSIAIDPSGQYLYTADQAGQSISAFTVDSSSGGLTPIAGSPFPTGFTPSVIKVSPNGDLLFAAAQGYVLVFTLQSGTPTLAGYYNAAILPGSMAVDPGERFLYITDTYDNAIVAFSIAAGGALTPIAGTPFAMGGGDPVSIAVDSSGTYVFTANHSTDNVSSLTIDSTTGALTLVSGAPFAAGTAPASVVYDSSTKDVYVSNQGSSNASVFSVGSGGTLSSVGTSTVNAAPTAIAVTN